MKITRNSTITSTVAIALLTASGILCLPLGAQSFTPDRESVWAVAGFGAAIGDDEIFVGRPGREGAIYPAPGTRSA